jgi:hypothetical protein
VSEKKCKETRRLPPLAELSKREKDLSYRRTRAQLSLLYTLAVAAAAAIKSAFPVACGTFKGAAGKQVGALTRKPSGRGGGEEENRSPVGMNKRVARWWKYGS